MSPFCRWRRSGSGMVWRPILRVSRRKSFLLELLMNNKLNITVVPSASFSFPFSIAPNRCSTECENGLMSYWWEIVLIIIKHNENSWVNVALKLKMMHLPVWLDLLWIWATHTMQPWTYRPYINKLKLKYWNRIMRYCWLPWLRALIDHFLFHQYIC